ncbi:MAG: hypothetical protein J6A37_05025 [Oscillospiraceae bacterium]|nr:hypothetical protein [Oscillospiraceae bacterium]
MNNFKNKIPIIAGILFLMANVIAVLSAWITDTHRYDLGISFSAYVGLSRPTSVVWFVSAVIIITMLIYYIAKIKIILFKKIIYAVVLLCIFGTALFPYNFYSEAPTAITISLHNDFAICLMLVTMVSFILSAIFSKSKKQRIVSLMSIVYAVAFIVFYFIRFQPLFQTFFIWENVFILLLLLEMQSEQYVAIKAESNN